MAISVRNFSSAIGQRLATRLREWTRLRPAFLIIGAQRCGTTSLYSYLAEHPLVVSAARKEVHFFDVNYGRGPNWYRQQFASRLDPPLRRNPRLRWITGEASPYYLFHPLAPRRAAQLLPDVKLIAILRNPVDRALSHYHHEVRRRNETLPFADAIAAEEGRMRGERELMIANGSYRSHDHQRFSYAGRGCYMDQLNDWLKFFARDQLLVVFSDRFYAEPPAVLREITNFLRLPPLLARDEAIYDKHNYAEYKEMNPALREQLVDYFRPHNARLEAFLGTALGWDK